jgi:hypothetical protein
MGLWHSLVLWTSLDLHLYDGYRYVLDLHESTKDLWEISVAWIRSTKQQRCRRFWAYEYQGINDQGFEIIAMFTVSAKEGKLV